MKKVYYDVTKLKECVSYFSSSAQIIPAGTTLYPMSICHKNDTYKKYAKEFDICFIFEDCIPKVDFYTVPQVDIFATDSFGGYIATLGNGSDFESDAPICYIDKHRNCYLITNTGSDFLSNVSNWKSSMTPCCDIIFYNSMLEAKESLEFIDTDTKPTHFSL